MKIILANPRGFCAGVNMAIESLERALQLYGTPIYVYHEIVHNRPVVEHILFSELGGEKIVVRFSHYLFERAGEHGAEILVAEDEPAARVQN